MLSDEALINSFLKEAQTDWKDQKVVNPSTGKLVKIRSLPVKEQEKYRPKKEHTNVKKKQYSWGDLRKVEFGKGGIDGHAVVHPEHHEKIKKLKPGESADYRDEQKINWKVQRSDDGHHVHFKSKGMHGLKGKVDWKKYLE